MYEDASVPGPKRFLAQSYAAIVFLKMLEEHMGDPILKRDPIVAELISPLDAIAENRFRRNGYPWTFSPSPNIPRILEAFPNIKFIVRLGGDDGLLHQGRSLARRLGVEPDEVAGQGHLVDESQADIVFNRIKKDLQ